MMNKTISMFTGILLYCSIAANASAAWIDWSSTTSGTMDYYGSSVNVSLSGPALDLVNGDYYYNNAYTGGTSPTGTYAGLAPSDLIRVNSTGTFTLTFDAQVDDLYMALVSVGQPSRNFVTYDFNNSFDVVSAGPNYWGYNGYTTTGNSLTGQEFNGILSFAGSYSSISFDVVNAENWHGFNFGTVDVPEPAALLLLASGLLGISLTRKRKI